ncbi:hypothetical protein BJV78DRAFT_728124 [Lactifluus subvellereus]|nr:hypothetical protein BJV78DRAFT_728124 [Lactifluus subvellereus]
MISASEVATHPHVKYSLKPHTVVTAEVPSRFVFGRVSLWVNKSQETAKQFSLMWALPSCMAFLKKPFLEPTFCVRVHFSNLGCLFLSAVAISLMGDILVPIYSTRRDKFPCTAYGQLAEPPHRSPLLLCRPCIFWSLLFLSVVSKALIDKWLPWHRDPTR